MKILIIGSKGFIGQHLLNFYRLQADKEVWGCDVSAEFEDSKYILMDNSNSDFESIFRSNHFDACINCSGAASVPESLINPSRDFYLNTFNVFNLLNNIRIFSPSCKFLNLSSAAVYGNPNKLPIAEDASLQPMSPYGYHKVMAENICKEFKEFYNIDACSVRIFSAYGNSLKKQLFWDVYKKSKGSNYIDFFGTGKETRDFIHISDVVQAIDLILQNSAFDVDCYNIANGEEIEIRVAIEQLLYQIGWQGEFKFNNHNRAGDPLYWCADIKKIKDLGYAQKITIKQGLKEYSEWLKELD
jgi:UDP-glucose 4-epimerase